MDKYKELPFSALVLNLMKDKLDKEDKLTIESIIYKRLASNFNLDINKINYLVMKEKEIIKKRGIEQCFYLFDSKKSLEEVLTFYYNNTLYNNITITELVIIILYFLNINKGYKDIIKKFSNQKKHISSSIYKIPKLKTIGIEEKVDLIKKFDTENELLNYEIYRLSEMKKYFNLIVEVSTQMLSNNFSLHIQKNNKAALLKLMWFIFKEEVFLNNGINKELINIKNDYQIKDYNASNIIERDIKRLELCGAPSYKIRELKELIVEKEQFIKNLHKKDKKDV